MTYAEHSGHVHYVTARSGPKTALLAGPFRTRQEAEAVEPVVRQIVRNWSAGDMDVTFAEVGTVRAELRPGRVAPLGKLNARLGIAS